ncbi:MAG: hypothetical protein B6I20_10200 [Bacteroidetes bacterium 4572_117]|nr:MAG: hypothetical protein B6I20_10200 [Bacteroidetes bacterium 4572_117]
MSTEITGKVVKILPEQKGQGKNGTWVKQEFVIETMDQYPKKACFSAWGDKTAAIKQLITGDEITVSFNIESREYNERWYTDLRAWKIVKGSQTTSSPNINDAPPLSENDIPPEEESSDLPF